MGDTKPFGSPALCSFKGADFKEARFGGGPCALPGIQIDSIGNTLTQIKPCSSLFFTYDVSMTRNASGSIGIFNSYHGHANDRNGAQVEPDSGDNLHFFPFGVGGPSSGGFSRDVVIHDTTNINAGGAVEYGGDFHLGGVVYPDNVGTGGRTVSDYFLNDAMAILPVNTLPNFFCYLVPGLYRVTANYEFFDGAGDTGMWWVDAAPGGAGAQFNSGQFYACCWAVPAYKTYDREHWPPFIVTDDPIANPQTDAGFFELVYAEDVGGGGQVVKTFSLAKSCYYFMVFTMPCLSNNLNNPVAGINLSIPFAHVDLLVSRV